MSLRSHSRAVVTVVLLSLVSMKAAPATPTGSMLDARYEAQLWTIYAQTPSLHACDISVSVEDGKAVLSGTVEAAAKKALAGEIALRVAGIQNVDNQILVRADAAAATLAVENSDSDGVDDASIRNDISSKLSWSKWADKMTVRVASHRGFVVLRGIADDAATRDLASYLASTARGVMSVENRITLAARGVAAAKGEAENLD